MQSLSISAALWGLPSLLDSEGLSECEESGTPTTPLILP
jgi:hypothetical protein